MKIKIEPALDRMHIYIEANLHDGSQLRIDTRGETDLEQIKLHAERILDAFGIETVEVYDDDYLLFEIKKEDD